MSVENCKAFGRCPLSSRCDNGECIMSAISTELDARTRDHMNALNERAIQEHRSKVRGVAFWGAFTVASAIAWFVVLRISGAL